MIMDGETKNQFKRSLAQVYRLDIEEQEDEEYNHHSFSGQGAGHEERQAEAEAPRMKVLSVRLERDPELDRMSQLLSQRQ